jgi:aquaporin Z
MRDALARHWPEYLIEAAALGLFMLAACIVTALVQHPGSPVHMAVADPLARRAIIGIAMGATAVALIYSPWGMRSGAHLNPAVTLTYLRLGKIARPDAFWYVAAQFAGATLGVALAVALVGRMVIGDPAVNYVVTRPGIHGAAVAFVAEAAISGLLMLVVLEVSNRPAINRFTGLIAGALVLCYVAFEAPVSGMSMNPARSFGSAASALRWQELWIYFAAPLAGMLAAAEIYVRLHGRAAVLCCKLHHENATRCIFRCGYVHHSPRAGAPAPITARNPT